MTPIQFGPPDRRLFGLLQPAQGAPARCGVVLCNPLGQEAVRVHRMYRVLADRLNRAGLHVLRFDWFGTGDSAGDDEAADLDGWQVDLLMAHRELKARLPCDQMMWIGARLGATVAARASAQVPGGLLRLLLWEPVLDGPAYLQALVHDHHEALRENYSILPAPWRERMARGDTAVHGELLGFALSQRLCAQLEGLAAGTVGPGTARECILLGRTGDRLLAQAVQRWQAQMPDEGHCRFVALDHAFDWTSEEALNTALVPASAVQRLADLATAPAGQVNA
jgi:pimeloyl-ACP methyl ester carboxylesterase